MPIFIRALLSPSLQVVTESNVSGSEAGGSKGDSESV